MLSEDLNEKIGCFLVYYEEKDGKNYGENIPGGIIDFFRTAGFKCISGYWGCPWYFVNISSKTYAPGRPGVQYSKVLCEHAITLDEFKTIYYIYNKYRDLPILKMAK